MKQDSHHESANNIVYGPKHKVCDWPQLIAHIARFRLIGPQNISTDPNTWFFTGRSHS